MLVIGALGTVIGLIANAISPQQGFDVVTVLLLPITYGVSGFVMGAITAFLYNHVSKWIGGLEVELSEHKKKKK